MLNKELLNKLQEEQQKLDNFIIEKKGITDSETSEARLRLKIALLAETGELANELATFKHWKNQEMDVSKCQEELIDCLHFFLSLTNKLKIDFRDWKETDPYFFKKETGRDWNELLETFFRKGCTLELKACRCDDCEGREDIIDSYYCWLRSFEKIAFKLGLKTKEEIEKVYTDKNKKNWDRQDQDY